MLSRLATIVAVVIFLAVLFTSFVYLWGSSKAVRIEKSVAPAREESDAPTTGPIDSPSP